MMFLKSALISSIPGVVHGFGTREEPLPLAAELEWSERKPEWKQVHGTAVALVESPKQACGEVDALITEKPGLPIAVVTADCVPVLMAHRSGKAVACIHAGWRGTLARILRETWRRLESLDHSPSEWVAAIGPAIGPCCYEVSQELASEFVRQFPDHPSDLVSPRSRILDLPAINAAELRAIGFAEVELPRACTMCSFEGESPLYFSYRREGTGTRQWSIIMRRTE